MTELLIKRAENEIITAEKLKRMSEDFEAKIFMEIPKDITFYSSVISHAYYSIFYSARALLLTKNITVASPNVHSKTLKEFKKQFVNTGILDKKLFEIYQDILIKADSLLQIFKDEKWKRGNFTYNTISQANKQPAEESLENAKLFVSSIRAIIY